jgi:hypothetical protein
MLNFRNVRLVGMTPDQLREAFNLRVGANGQLFLLPDDIIENTIKAFAVSATSPTGYGAQGPPSGRYLAPANGPDCIETAPSFGDCGVGSLVLNGPPLINFDLSVVKRIKLRDVTFEFRADFLNAFNRPYFTPITGMTTNVTAPPGPIQTGTLTSNATTGVTSDSFRLTNPLGDNPSRIIQLVWRVRW